MWHFSLHFYVTLACLIALFYTHKTSHKLALNYEFSTEESPKGLDGVNEHILPVILVVFQCLRQKGIQNQA